MAASMQGHEERDARKGVVETLANELGYCIQIKLTCQRVADLIEERKLRFALAQRGLEVRVAVTGFRGFLR